MDEREYFYPKCHPSSGVVIFITDKTDDDGEILSAICKTCKKEVAGFHIFGMATDLKNYRKFGVETNETDTR